MTDALSGTLTMRGRGWRRFDLFLVLAPALGAASFASMLAAPTLADQVKSAGLMLMMLSLGGYLFQLRGLPVQLRPPVTFTPFVTVLIALFCVGTMICGTGFVAWSGVDPVPTAELALGSFLMMVPSTGAFLTGVWLISSTGRKWRAGLAARSC